MMVAAQYAQAEVVELLRDKYQQPVPNTETVESLKKKYQ